LSSEANLRRHRIDRCCGLRQNLREGEEFRDS
jgi:hypothetical protein